MCRHSNASSEASPGLFIKLGLRIYGFPFEAFAPLAGIEIELSCPPLPSPPAFPLLSPSFVSAHPNEKATKNREVKLRDDIRRPRAKRARGGVSGGIPPGTLDNLLPNRKKRSKRKDNFADYITILVHYHNGKPSKFKSYLINTLHVGSSPQTDYRTLSFSRAFSSLNKGHKSALVASSLFNAKCTNC
jgi:hypothetical protein